MADTDNYLQLTHRLFGLARASRRGRLPEREEIYLTACLDHWQATVTEWRKSERPQRVLVDEQPPSDR
ncbi:hypothetical protein A5766_04710 [Gordonia sp. 852002-51296_SCH5728562-b]|nr:hypothetical protein A5766_04710 [Gordonia sp. 852002-51296_SCH5728562-b]